MCILCVFINGVGYVCVYVCVLCVFINVVGYVCVSVCLFVCIVCILCVFINRVGFVCVYVCLCGVLCVYCVYLLTGWGVSVYVCGVLWQFPLADIESRTDEISKCTKHTILVDNYGYIWIIMVQ